MTQDSKFNNLRARKKHNFLTLEWFGETQQKISQLIILKIKNICSKMSSRPFFYHFAITLIVKSTANFLILEQTIKIMIHIAVFPCVQYFAFMLL